jgi:hypothetical protein
METPLYTNRVGECKKRSMSIHPISHSFDPPVNIAIHISSYTSIRHPCILLSIYHPSNSIPHQLIHMSIFPPIKKIIHFQYAHLSTKFFMISASICPPFKNQIHPIIHPIDLHLSACQYIYRVGSHSPIPQSIQHFDTSLSSCHYSSTHTII